MAIVRDGTDYDELTGHGEAELVLDRTPFYAEGGGQVGDRGVLREPGGGSIVFEVEDTQKPVGGLIVHRGTLTGRLRVGETVAAVVDAERRADTMRNHTGTHLLHRALRNVVGERARQAGSLVAPGLPALRLPVRSAADRGREARHRGRGPPHRPRGPARHHRVHEHGRGDRGRRGRVLRREVRRDGPDDPGRGLLASSCAAAPTAGRPGRSAASSSPASAASARACAASRPSRAPPRTRSLERGSSPSSARPRSPAPRPSRPCRSASRRSRTSCGRRSGG